MQENAMPMKLHVQNLHSRLWLKQVPGTLGTKAEQSTWFQIRDEAEGEQLLNSGAGGWEGGSLLAN